MLTDVVRFPKIASLPDPTALTRRLAELQLDLRADPHLETGPDAPMAQPIRIGQHTLANRWCIQPMEGWDGTRDGRPSAWTLRRWRHFGQSGAKLIWGGEAVSVSMEGRGNPNQLVINERTVRDLRTLREALADEHAKHFGRNGLLVGLQLAHSGRFCRPNAADRLEPRLAYHHPILDARHGIAPNAPLVSDDWLEDLIESFIRAAELAAEAGFAMVDIKHCHGYLGHDLLAGHTRPGPFGGSFENRTRFLRRVVESIHRRVPELLVGVRVSAFDTVPFAGSPLATGTPAEHAHLLPYRWGFGVNADDPTQIDLSEPRRFVKL